MTALDTRIANAIHDSAVVADALASKDAKAIFGTIDQWAKSVLQQALFTVNRFDEENMAVVRLYSSDPVSYPPGGSKQKRGMPWGEHVLLKRQIYVGEGSDAIRESFDDHAAILGLGLQSVINVPVVVGDQCLGTVNFLMREPKIQEAHINFARLAAQLTATGFR
jgi:GAF domain-containing protein